MDPAEQIELALAEALDTAERPNAPPKLAAAMKSAVFPGGARVRPRLCLAVSKACIVDFHCDDAPYDLSGAAAAATAIELMHCASLAHDDLPCFDDAEVRRGKPSLHRRFGEAIAILAGDGLIVLAFQVLAAVQSAHAERALALTRILAAAVGAPRGLVAGQAWESETEIDLRAYHRAKTGALFVAATMSGAAAVGGDPENWRAVGERLGEAYQVADDLLDRHADLNELGKPVGQDAVHARPNAVDALGVDGALEHLTSLIDDAADAVPACSGAEELRRLVYAQAKRLSSAGLVRKSH